MFLRDLDLGIGHAHPATAENKILVLPAHAEHLDKILQELAGGRATSIIGNEKIVDVRASNQRDAAVDLKDVEALLKGRLTHVVLVLDGLLEMNVPRPSRIAGAIDAPASNPNLARQCARRRVGLGHHEQQQPLDATGLEIGRRSVHAATIPVRLRRRRNTQEESVPTTSRRVAANLRRVLLATLDDQASLEVRILHR